MVFQFCKLREITRYGSLIVLVSFSGFTWRCQESCKGVCELGVFPGFCSCKILEFKSLNLLLLFSNVAWIFNKVRKCKIQKMREKTTGAAPEVCGWVLKGVSYQEDSCKDERDECNLRSFLNFDPRRIPLVSQWYKRLIRV